MERKFKVGQWIKYINGTIGKVAMNNHTTYQGSPYLIECRNGGRFFSTEAELQSIPEPSNFERGEKVWHKTLMSVWEFHRYDDQININLCVVNKLNSYLTTPESDIEPYAGQDKVKEETQKERNSRLAAELINEVTRLHPELKQSHPFTVILKSGVKVGVSNAAQYELTGCISSAGGESSDVFNTIVFQSKEYSFRVSEIAAIVPTENIMP